MTCLHLLVMSDEWNEPSSEATSVRQRTSWTMYLMASLSDILSLAFIFPCSFLSCRGLEKTLVEEAVEDLGEAEEAGVVLENVSSSSCSIELARYNNG